MASQPKRAVVIIHGMGNQSPMGTLRGFVDAVWTNDPRLSRHGTRETWSKPDAVSGSRELRRITTSEDRLRKRTDFFEFYWAHMMEDTQLSSVLSWLRRLFLRRPDRVPPAVMAPWLAGWAAILVLLVALAALVLLGLAVLMRVGDSVWAAAGPLVPMLALLGLLWFLRHRVLVEVVGDAARYLTPAPPNIGARSRIRAAGLDLLRQLHASDEYDRVILVCHSLGTVVGYDLLSFYWADICSDIVFPTANGGHRTLADVEAKAAALRAAGEDVMADALSDYRSAQRAFAADVAAVSGGGWKVTDFVTLGSPLTHAHFLLVDDGEQALPADIKRIGASWLSDWRKRLDAATAKVAELFSARAAQREFPLCPPLTEKGDRFSYEPKSRKRSWSPHHAALFSAVRWTNVFAPRRLLLWGDAVGGPVAPLFGPGVKDVALSGAVGRSFIAHVRYWEQGHADREHLEALRAAINLLDEPDAEAWRRHEEEIKSIRGAATG